MSNSRIDSLLNILASSPKDTFVLYALALEYKQMNELDEAATYFLKCKIQDESYLALYYHYGNLLVLQQKYSEAQNILKQGIEIAIQQNDMKTKSELEFALEDVEDLM